MITILISLAIILIFGFIFCRPREIKRDFFCFKDSCIWSWKGGIGRGPYLILGLILFNVKHLLDKFVYHSIYAQHGVWQLFDYLYPFRHLGQRELMDIDIRFFSTLFLIAIPFIYFGVGLTIRRLRALQLPLWLSILFFVPIINLIFFLIVSMLPAQEDINSRSLSPVRCFLDRIIPDSPAGSAIAAILVNAVVALIGVFLGASIFKQYGVSLFVAGPFSLGLIAAIIHGYHGNRTLRSCVGVASLSVVILSAVFFAFAIEGVICIIMALPLGIVMAAFGAWVGYYIQLRPSSKNDSSRLIILIFTVMPLLMGFEYATKPEPVLFAVKTYVDVNAPVETVWKNVVEFSRLPEPTEMLFKVGISYPTHAEIKGEGVGAIRYCNFSTGSFVEPITVWDENRLLKFDVVDQPVPMKELSPYNVDAPHLHGYMVSQKGQFLLRELPEGKIRLEGTTWYTNKMWPESYWKIWSDYIIHKIHLRVLKHIRNISEG